jgi:hypothetical protein
MYELVSVQTQMSMIEFQRVTVLSAELSLSNKLSFASPVAARSLITPQTDAWNFGYRVTIRKGYHEDQQGQLTRVSTKPILVSKIRISLRRCSSGN